MLRPVVHDVGDDQPPRLSGVAVRQRLVQSRLVEGLHVAPEADVLLEAERMDRREVVEHEPVVPDVGLPDVVPDAGLAPAPVDVDEMPERVERAAVVEDAGPTELLVRQVGRRRQDAVVRPRVEPHECEQAVAVHPRMLDGGLVRPGHEARPVEVWQCVAYIPEREGTWTGTCRLKLVHVLSAIVAVGTNVTYFVWLAAMKGRAPSQQAFALDTIKKLDCPAREPRVRGAPAHRRDHGPRSPTGSGSPRSGSRSRSASTSWSA